MTKLIRRELLYRRVARQRGLPLWQFKRDLRRCVEYGLWTPA